MGLAHYFTNAVEAQISGTCGGAKMNRRKFLYSCATTVALWQERWMRGESGVISPFESLHTDLNESIVGNPCNLALFGEMQSWLSPEATPLLQKQMAEMAAGALRLAELPWKDSEFDIGVEWPEFRTVDQVVIRFTREDRSPERGKQFVEFWDGLTPRQGNWRTL
jgi:hypothetical protein